MHEPLYRYCLLIFLCLLLPTNAYGQEKKPHDAPNKPNVVLILVDDAGLMDFEPYGGEAKMPTLSSLAEKGVMFTNYRTSPLCSPSRAMLLTGIDNHQTGVASIPELLPAQHQGKPGYTMHLESGVKTLADQLKNAGYRTYMTGKWHMGSEIGDLPVSHGFDRSFVLDASGADNWEQKPYIPYYDTAPWFEDDKPATLPDDFYSSQFIVDKMIDYIGQHKGPEQPFFAYLAFQAIHIPIQAPKEFIEQYQGKYDQGWHVLRHKRWQKAQALGLIPSGAPLKPMPENFRQWDTLSDEERRYYSKAMAVNAAMLAAMDHHINRLITWLKAHNKFDNTLFVVTSDNGPEFNDIAQATAIDLWYLTSGYHKDIEGMGERGSLVSIGPEWALAAASPSDKFKFYTTAGGIRVPLIMMGPSLQQGQTTDAFSLVTDITPTILDVLNIHLPPVQPNEHIVAMTGRSLKPILHGQANAVYAPDEAIGMEVGGNEALFKGAYKISRNLPPHGDGVWRMYDLSIDPGETHNLTKEKPDLFQAMQADYRQYALDVGVLAMPKDFDSMKQVTINSSKQYLKANWLVILLTSLVVLLIFWRLFNTK